MNEHADYSFRFRSGPTTLFQMEVWKKDARKVVDTFNELDKGQFLDLNKNWASDSLPFRPQFEQIEKAVRNIESILEECEKHSVNVTPAKNDEWL